MNRSFARHVLITFALASLGSTLLVHAAAPSPVRIGMVRTFFNDVPRPLVDLVTEPFGAVMKEATGLQGELLAGGEVFEVGRQLNDGELHLGVFHSFEFAWLQTRYPALKPLMVAVNPQKQVRVYMVVRKDSAAQQFTDLKGQVISLPKRSKEHSKIFLDRHAPECQPASIVASANVEVGMDDVCRGAIAGVVVDTMSLEFYRDLKPGCFAKLRVLHESDLFPPPVIVYREGGLDASVLTKVRQGLTNAHNLELGREMMKLWKIGAFQQMPENYGPSLVDMIKLYPIPESAKVSQR